MTKGRMAERTKRMVRAARETEVSPSCIISKEARIKRGKVKINSKTGETKPRLKASERLLIFLIRMWYWLTRRREIKSLLPGLRR